MIPPVLRSAVCSLMNTKIFSIDSISKISCLNFACRRCIHLTLVDLKKVRVDNVKVNIKNVNKQITFEGGVTASIIEFSGDLRFPDHTTPNKLFDGVMFKDLPIINVKATANNTILTLTDSQGLVKATHSAGIEGFKNAKKGTNIAGQQAANTFGVRAINNGMKTVRLTLQGIGPGRMAAMKGLELAGINIVSVTDTTRVSWNPPRARKPRRL
ncbi:mitochondrial ribosomal protein S11 [Megalopta genalis]|uniref:mitochondrial ribosomal protein S11 n=1 Tax=Megalopta genalis TaxID=115081 RepID=UPI003FD2EB26